MHCLTLNCILYGFVVLRILDGLLDACDIMAYKYKMQVKIKHTLLNKRSNILFI